MVQIVNMSPKPSMAGSFGEGFNKGFSTSLQRSIDAGLAYKLNDMLDAKKYARQQEDSGQRGIAALSVFKPNASDEEKAAAYALGPDMTIKLMENLGESGFASFVASGKVPVGGQEQQPQQPRQNNVLGQPQVETINIQGMPERRPQQQQPPFILPQYQEQYAQQQAQQSPQQQTQQPAMPEQAMQRAASMSDREWADWLDRQQISKDWKIKYSHERTKQQEMDLKQRADLRAEEERGEKRTKFQLELKKQPKEVVKYVQDQTKAASSSRDIVKILDRMAELRKTGRTGWAMGGAISAENRKTRAEYDGLASQLIKLYKNVAGSKGITQGEFAKIADEWLPSSKFTEATNEGREAHFRFEADTALKDFEKMRSLVGEDGKYPLDIQERVAESEAPPEESNQQVYQSLPDPSQFKTGDVMRDTKTGRRMMHNGFTWVEAK